MENRREPEISLVNIINLMADDERCTHLLAFSNGQTVFEIS